MIYCKELNENYDNEKDLFKDLRDNKDLIISSKKSKIYEGVNKGVVYANSQESIQKVLTAEKGISIDDSYYYFVVNSSKILDSHRDLHIDGNWEKTKKEQQGKVFLVFDHQLKRDDIIAMKEDIELVTATIPFATIGKGYAGDTYCLIYKVRKDKIINTQAKEWLEKGYSLEASVRMQYMDIVFCANSNDEDDVKEKQNFDKYYPTIANKNEFENIRYFWAIKQAKNTMESSLVMFGSNSATGLIPETKETEPSKDTQSEPSKDTQANKIDYKYLIENLK